MEKIMDEKRLRIAMVLDVYDDLNNGAVISTRRFEKLLSENHDIKIISTGIEDHNRVALPSFYLPLVKKIMEKMKFTFAWPSKEILYKAFADVDIIHNQFSFFLGMKTIRIAREMEIPVISTFHVQPENMLYNVGIKSKLLIKLFYKFFLRTVYNKSDAVICPSGFSRDELVKNGLTVPNYIVSNGIMPMFHQKDVKRDEKLKDKFVILSVGRLAREKRHDVLIEAVKRSKSRDSIYLMICGTGPMKKKIEEEGKTLGYNPVEGYITQDKLVDYYNKADLYIHPSEIEIEGMTILEAIACGVPAMVSDSPKSATKQFALDSRFIFKNADPEDLAKKIDYLIMNRQELKKAKTDYLELAKTYKIESSAEKLEEIYYKYLSIEKKDSVMTR